MKKIFQDIIFPTFMTIMVVIGLSTVCVSITQACTTHSSTSTVIQDMTQTDVDSLINSNKNLNMRLNDCIRTIDAYRAYYNHVEQLLDKAGIDVDSPLLETDEGAEYLDKKWIVDSLENENLGTPSINE